MIQSFRSPIRAFALALLTATLVMGRAYAADAPGEDPAALAARYAKQAVELRASADSHEKTAAMHRAKAGNPKVSHVSIQAHCEAIAKSLRAAADESDKLAAEYRALAPSK